MIIPHKLNHRQWRWFDFESKFIIIIMLLFFYSSFCHSPKLLLLTIRIASSQKYDIARQFFTKKSFIHDYLFYISKAICCIKLIKKYP